MLEMLVTSTACVIVCVTTSNISSCCELFPDHLYFIKTRALIHSSSSHSVSSHSLCSKAITEFMEEPLEVDGVLEGYLD